MDTSRNNVLKCNFLRMCIRQSSTSKYYALSTMIIFFQAADAVQAGVCVDLFAVTDEYTDLASLKFLSIESGGSLFYYSNTDDSTLPQDM
jgi:Sec23/Sec24 trunk domain